MKPKCIAVYPRPAIPPEIQKVFDNPNDPAHTRYEVFHAVMWANEYDMKAEHAACWARAKQMPVSVK